MRYIYVFHFLLPTPYANFSKCFWLDGNIPSFSRQVVRPPIGHVCQSHLRQLCPTCWRAATQVWVGERLCFSIHEFQGQADFQYTCGMAADFLWGSSSNMILTGPLVMSCTVPPSCQDEGCADGAECLWAASCVGHAFLSQRDAATQIWRVRSYLSKDRHIIAWYQHLASLAQGTGAMRIQWPSRCDGNGDDDDDDDDDEDDDDDDDEEEEEEEDEEDEEEDEEEEEEEEEYDDDDEDVEKEETRRRRRRRRRRKRNSRRRRRRSRSRSRSRSRRRRWLVLIMITLNICIPFQPTIQKYLRGFGSKLLRSSPSTIDLESHPSNTKYNKATNSKYTCHTPNMNLTAVRI